MTIELLFILQLFNLFTLKRVRRCSLKARGTARQALPSLPRMLHAACCAYRTQNRKPSKRKRQGSPATTATTKRHTIALARAFWTAVAPIAFSTKHGFATEITKTGDADGQHRRNTSSIQSGSNANTFPFMDPCRRAEKRRSAKANRQTSRLSIRSSLEELNQ